MKYTYFVVQRSGVISLYDSNDNHVVTLSLDDSLTDYLKKEGYSQDDNYEKDVTDEKLCSICNSPEDEDGRCGCTNNDSQ